MPLAKAFEKDIFISYCHADNEDPMGDGWVELFHKILRTRLIQILGARVPEEQPTFWRDDSLQGNDEFADVLADKLRDVALVVSVMSPSYVKSDWCRREIEAFCSAATLRGGVVVGENKGRILKVLKDPVPRDEHPDVLKGQTGFPFYTMDPERQRPVPFTLTKGDETIALAKRVIDDLAYSIIATLQAVNEYMPEALRTSVPVPVPMPGSVPATAAMPVAGAPGAAAPSAGTVFLAECELEEERQQLRRDLEARGVTVLPAGDLPVRKPDEFKHTVREALAQCDVSVHLVAATRSLVLRGEVEDTVSLQNQLAAERSAEGALRRVIWLPPGLEVAADDERQRAFVDMLQRDPAAQRGAEVLTVPLQGLIEHVHTALRKQLDAKARKPEPARADGVPVQVYLITDPADIEAADPLRQALIDQGFDVLERLSDPGATPEQMQADHKQNVVDCAAAIVYVGAAGENWAKSLFGEIQKANGWRDPAAPLRARAIYLAAPADAYKAKYLRKAGFTTIDAREGFAAPLLQPFVDEVHATAGGPR